MKLGGAVEENRSGRFDLDIIYTLCGRMKFIMKKRKLKIRNKTESD